MPWKISVEGGACAIAAGDAPLTVIFARRHDARRGEDSPALLQAQSPGCGGRLELHQTTPVVGKQWTDTGDRHEKRGLKNRPGRAIRIVPIPGELVAILRAHIPSRVRHQTAGCSAASTGECSIPRPAGTSGSRPECLRCRQPRSHHRSPRRPYDLRHGGVSLRLNAGVPATQVAEWAGHSVEVLLTIYAKCIEGRDRVWFERIDQALGGGPV